MKIKKSNFNWFGFKHPKVLKKFEGDLSYCGTFSIKDKKGNYHVWAVYHSKNPNKEKGHKDYMLLALESMNFITGDTKNRRLLVSGLSSEDMEKERYQLGKYCPDCKELIYSVERHDYRNCKCGKCSVDGGKDYYKFSVYGKTINIDLITGKEYVPNSVSFIKSLKKEVLLV